VETGQSAAASSALLEESNRRLKHSESQLLRFDFRLFLQISQISLAEMTAKRVDMEVDV
jgi:hypothetical protein